MTTVSDWMSTDLVTVSPFATVADARHLLETEGIRHLPVVNRDRLVGMVSDRDVGISDESLRTAVRRREVMALLDDQRKVDEVMTVAPRVISPDEPVSEAARMMVSRRINALPVVDADGTLRGLVTSTDCLLAALEAVEVDDDGNGGAS